MANPILIGTLIAAIVTPEPDTKCPTCWLVEANTFHRFWRHLPSSSMISVLCSALGSPATWYERHRSTYVSTGSQIELERMLRHVDTISS